MLPFVVRTSILSVALISATPAYAQYTRISVSTAGVEANGPSSGVSISEDGRFVAFASEATNLVASDTNGVSDIFLRDRDTDTDGVFDEPGAVSTVLISRYPGAQFTAPSRSPVVNHNGYMVTFVTDEPCAVAPTRTCSRIFLWSGAYNGTIVEVTPQGANGNSDSPAMSDNGTVIVFRSDATNLVAGDAGEAGGVFVAFVGSGAPIRRLSPPVRQPDDPSFDIKRSVTSPAISADGRIAGFVSGGSSNVPSYGFSRSGAMYTVDLATDTPTAVASAIDLFLDRTGSRAAVIGSTLGPFGSVSSYYLPTARPTASFPGRATADRPAASPDARYLVQPGGAITGTPLYDFVFRRVDLLPFRLSAADIAGNNRLLAFVSDDPSLVGASPGALPVVFVADLQDLFDVDHDLLDDRWERFFGLDATTASGAEGAAGDPDGDGVSNAAEQAAGTHPRGFHRRYLAEGATGSFFRTRIAVANPDLSPSTSASALLTFLRSDGNRSVEPLTIVRGTRETVFAETIEGLASADFSTVVESDRPLVVDRTMMWDTRSPLTESGYGAHSETAVDAPATHWYLAEGTTVLTFDLFYLLQNPQDTPTDATIRYLRPSGAPLVRTYTLPPHSRTTIYVNIADPELAETDVSGDIEATAPIIVERAMYASRPGQPFALGTASKGVTAPAVTWFLAEGATGAFFDTYVLIANPSLSTAEVTVRFDPVGRASVTRRYSLAPSSRTTLFLDGIEEIGDTSVSTTVTSTNGVPVVVERAMYWPNGFYDYYEGHTSAGVTAPGLKWALAEGEGSYYLNPQTFVLIANTSSAAGRVRVTTLNENHAAPGPGDPFELDLPPNSRTTVPMKVNDYPGRFGVLVESIGPTPAPIVVEGAFYWTVDGVLWAAGSSLVATKLP
jgi:hypothetical protein